MADQRRPRAELKPAHFAERGVFRVFFRSALFQVRLQVVTVRVGLVAVGASMRPDLLRGFFDAAGGRSRLCEGGIGMMEFFCFDLVEKNFGGHSLAVRARLFYQFIFDEMPLLMLNETEELAENHRTDEAVEAGREIGSHPPDRRHRFRRNPFVVDGAAPPMRREPPLQVLLQIRQLIFRRRRVVERHIVVDIHHDDEERQAF